MAKQPKWLPLFRKFIKSLRIQSKHAVDDDGDGIELKMWTSQTRVLEQICQGLDDGKHQFYVLKSRQLGVTTITVAITLFWLALHPNTIGCIVSDSDKNASKNRETVRRYLKSLAAFMGKSFSITRDNRFGFTFSNGSRLDMLVAGKSKVNWGEGEGYVVGHLCVAKGTPVVIENGSIKPIEDITIGDKVLTHTGAQATVIDVMGQPNHKGPMMRITPWNGQPLTCSLDHTIPTHRGTIEARDLRPTDKLIMPVRKITHTRHQDTLPENKGRSGEYYVDAEGRFVDGKVDGAIKRVRARWQTTISPASGKTIEFTEELGFSIGYYLAEGYLIKQQHTGTPTGITFTRHRDEIKYADRAIAAIAKFTTGTRKTVDRKDCLSSCDTVYGAELCKWIDENFGSLENKRIPDWVFEAGEPFCRGILCGLLCGDGSKTVTKAQQYKLNTMVMPTTRASLAMQSRDIAASLGYGWGAIRYEAGGDKYGRICKPIWRVMWAGSAAANLRQLVGLPVVLSGHKSGEKYTIADGLVFIKIRKIEYDIPEPEMWDISVDHKDHTFRTPHMGIGNTEVASYGKAEGIESFRHAMAPNNPRALYIFESTAHGPNHWKDMWESAKEDEYSSVAIFVGWWSHDLQRIKMTDKRFAAFGTSPPTPEENDKLKAVKDKYDYEITMEQLAWYRWQQTLPNSNETDMDQNQPWVDSDAFIQSGLSFFQPRRLLEARERITSAPDALVEDGGFGFWGYTFYLADEYYMSKVEEATSKEAIKLRVWEKPHKDGLYVIGVDVAGGRSEDSNMHSCSVWRVYADKMVQVAEWADSIPETRHCAWVTAYIAGQYANCRINIDMTGGIGIAVMQAFEDLRSRMRSDMYGDKMKAAMAAARMERDAKREAEGLPPLRDLPTNGFGGNFAFDDFLSSSNWYLYRRVDSPGPGFMYNTVMSYKLKFHMMNSLRDSWVTNLLEIRSVPLLDEMANVEQSRSDIGASAPGRMRDDRTFAMALANMTWTENLRGGLIAQGVTWEGSKAKEAGSISPVAETLNRRIYSILRAADEDRDAPPPLTFFEQRGFS